MCPELLALASVAAQVLICPGGFSGDDRITLLIFLGVKAALNVER